MIEIPLYTSTRTRSTRQRQRGHHWRDCLGLVVSWNHEGILRQLLNCLKSVLPPTRKNLLMLAPLDFFFSFCDVAMCKNKLFWTVTSCLFGERMTVSGWWCRGTTRASCVSSSTASNRSYLPAISPAIVPSGHVLLSALPGCMQESPNFLFCCRPNLTCNNCFIFMTLPRAKRRVCLCEDRMTVSGWWCRGTTRASYANSSSASNRSSTPPRNKKAFVAGLTPSRPHPPPEIN